MTDPVDLQRDRMVAEQLRARGIRDERLLKAFRVVPRHLFVPADRQPDAYEDHPLPIGEGQTISQPYIVAVMLEALLLQPGQKVLEIGTGSGYQAALLASLGTRVYSMEWRGSLAEEAGTRLSRLGFSSVKIRVGDGSFGWPEEAPFDALVVAAAFPRVPVRLMSQWVEGGRMVVPVGEGLSQTLMQIERREGRTQTRPLCGCLFVPLVGEEGVELSAG